MNNLAPEITRQRLLVEGLYKAEITREKVEEYLLGLAAHLDLRVYGKPIIHAPEGIGKDGNEAFEQWLEPGDYASRPPGEVHGPFISEGECVVVEISYPSQSVVL